jgi:alpha-1,4-N-acetylglucosaminyltransferase EXTL3
VIKSEKNSLNNRFLPYEHIKTDAVLSLDDDMYLRADEIVLGFRVWRENRDRVVGFPARHHAWNLTANDFVYRSHLSCEYSMVLTGAAFYHRFYNYMFTYAMSAAIREKIDELNNCEDIAFNMLVTHVTRHPPLKVTTKYSFYCKECDNFIKNDDENANVTNSEDRVPVSLRYGHYEKRSQCMQYFISVYGYNPLMYSQYRADSVLYRTRTPVDVQKCFRFV